MNFYYVLATTCIFSQLTASISCSTTFRVCDKTPERVTPASYNARHTFGLVSHFKEYRQNECTRVVQETDFGPGVIEPAGQHGFISTVIQAYKGHHNLVIRPDDIWTGIISQFAVYINGNGTADKFRERFVNFSGTKQLVVNVGTGNLNTVPQAGFMELMTEQIHKNIADDEFRGWITPNFTTTTRDDKLAAGIVLMASTKQFFEYVENIACGIPKITLEGTEDDWKDVSARLVKLRSYELELWVDKMLGPILKQFVRAKAGKVDEEFWNSIVNVEAICGGPIISGWITAFSVFNADGKWMGGDLAASSETGKRIWPSIEIDQLVSGVVYADLLICNHGVRHEAVAFAGHFGQEILDEGHTLQPRVGWALALKNSTVSAVAGLDEDTIVVDIIEDKLCASI